MMKTRITIGGMPGSGPSPSSGHKPASGGAPGTSTRGTGAVAFQGFPRAGLKFLAELQENNNKAWFDAHRATYENDLLAPMRAFVAELGALLQASIAPT